MRHRVRQLIRAARTPAGAHYVILVVGFIAMAVVATRLWFYYDDWSALVQKSLDLLAPHNGHLSTIPLIIFLGLERVFGLHSYLPFAVPVILAHLILVHLLWRLAIRGGTRPWIATGLSLLLVFFGAGGENIVWAFQIGFVGAMAAVVGAIVVLDRDEPGVARYVAAAALVTAGLASSGTSLPLVVVALVLCFLRHGAVRTAATFAVPAVIYLAWYAAIGRHYVDPGRASTPGQLLVVPQFAVSMLSDGFGRVFPVAIFGGLVFVAIACFWLFTIRRAPRSAYPAYGLFLAAPMFALLTGYSRAGFGIGTAASSRYIYFVFLVSAPLISIALSKVTARMPLVPVLTVIVFIAAWNVGGLVKELDTRRQRADATAVHLAAAAALLRHSGSRYSPSAQPYPTWSPDITVADLREWLTRGWYVPGAYSRADTYSELAILDLDVRVRSKGPSSLARCDELIGAQEPGSTTADGSALIYAKNPTSAGIAVGTSTTEGESRSVALGAGWTSVHLDTDRSLSLSVTTQGLPIEVCPAG